MACSASDQLLACVCPRFVTPSRFAPFRSDVIATPAYIVSKITAVSHAEHQHIALSYQLTVYQQHVPVIVSPYLHIISIIGTRALTHELHCTFASGSSISPASAPWSIIPCPQNYNTIISQNRKEHISFGLQNTVWAHPLSTAGISNNVIINPSTTGTFYPVFSSLFLYVILVTSETNCTLINIDLIIAVTGLFIAFPAVICLLAFKSTSNTTCLSCFSIYMGFLTLAVSGCGFFEHFAAIATCCFRLSSAFAAFCSRVRGIGTTLFNPAMIFRNHCLHPDLAKKGEKPDLDAVAWTCGTHQPSFTSGAQTYTSRDCDSCGVWWEAEHNDFLFFC